MIFKTPIDQPSSRHPYSGWDYYQDFIRVRWHGAPPKIARVWHAKARQSMRSRAVSRHTLGIRRPDLVSRRGPSHLSASTSGQGPLIQPF